MAGLAVTDRQGRSIGTLTRSGVLGRLGIVAPVLVVVLAVPRLAPGAPWWPALVLLLLAVVTAEVPDGGWGLLTIAGTAAWWAATTAEAAVAWSLLPATALLVCHLATAFAAAGPPGRAPDPTTVARLARAAAPVLAGTVGLWLVTVAAQGRVVVPPPALAAALLAVAALPLVAVRR